MQPEVASVLGIAVAILVAAISSFAWLFKFAINIQKEQAKSRHELRNELHVIINEAEERLERRILRLEAVSLGLRDWARRNGNHGG